MTRTQLLDRCAQDGDQRIFLGRVLDKLELAQSRGIPAHTVFLSPAQKTAVSALLAAAGNPRHLFWGGYEGAERTVCLLLPDWQEEEAAADPTDAGPLAALGCTFSAEAGLTHRDLLGALMGLGITREKLGDLLVEESACTLVLLRETLPLVLSQWDGAGRCRFTPVPVPLDQITPVPVRRETLRESVATLRLDGVAAAAFSLSRGRAADLVTAGRVALNHRICIKPDQTVAVGDVLSCRGLGKCVVAEQIGVSKKGRTLLLLERYI